MTATKISTAEFIRHFGRYHDEAQRAPVTLTKHGRASVVVLSAETYARLLQDSDPRQAYASGETPADLADILRAGLDRQSAEYHADKNGK
jgi:prevent-host-death family protein